MTAPAPGAVLLTALRWQPLAGLGGLAVAVVAADRAWNLTGGPVGALRVTAALLGAGAAFALDDASAQLTDPVPRTRRARTGARIGAVAALAAVWWALALSITAGRLTFGQVLGLTLEMLAFLAIGLATAAALVWWADMPESGVAAGPAVLLVVPVLLLLPAHLALVVPPGQDWAAAHLRWAVLLAVAAAVVAGASRDPAA